jgi:hypothetical protein
MQQTVAAAHAIELATLDLARRRPAHARRRLEALAGRAVRPGLRPRLHAELCEAIADVGDHALLRRAVADLESAAWAANSAWPAAAVARARGLAATNYAAGARWLRLAGDEFAELGATVDHGRVLLRMADLAAANRDLGEARAAAVAARRVLATAGSIAWQLRAEDIRILADAGTAVAPSQSTGGQRRRGGDGS